MKVVNVVLRCLGTLAVVACLGIGAHQVRADSSDPFCHYSAGGCFDAGCRLQCAQGRGLCRVVHGHTGDSCSCECNMQE